MKHQWMMVNTDWRCRGQTRGRIAEQPTNLTRCEEFLGRRSNFSGAPGHCQLSQFQVDSSSTT